LDALTFHAMSASPRLDAADSETPVVLRLRWRADAPSKGRRNSPFCRTVPAVDENFSGHRWSARRRDMICLARCPPRLPFVYLITLSACLASRSYSSAIRCMIALASGSTTWSASVRSSFALLRQLRALCQCGEIIGHAGGSYQAVSQSSSPSHTQSQRCPHSGSLDDDNGIERQPANHREKRKSQPHACTLAGWVYATAFERTN
jgi:hypothetical protein